MERAARSSFRPGPSLVAVVALSTTVLGVPVPATDPGTPPAVSDREAPSAAPPAGPEGVVPRPITRVGPGTLDTGPPSTPHPASSGIPAGVYLAYQRAAARLAETLPGCRLPVALLAAIGRVESGHARGGRIDARGTTLTPILGPRLDGGPALAAIRDTDGGVYDGDVVWDRAVGPMQFIPGTWSAWAADGNGDEVADPHNVHDAALTAGGYLCAHDRDLSTEDGLRAGVLSYNRSEFYLGLVLRWMAMYERGVQLDPVPPAGPLPPEETGGATVPVTPAAPRPDTPPAAPPGPPAAEPAAPPAATPPAEPAPPTLADTVGETLCVVDGIVVSVTTATTSLLGGLLGQEVTGAPAGNCAPEK